MKKLLTLFLLTISIGCLGQEYCLFKKVEIVNKPNYSGSLYRDFYDEPICFYTKNDLDSYLNTNNCNGSIVVDFKKDNMYIIKTENKFINEFVEKEKSYNNRIILEGIIECDSLKIK